MVRIGALIRRARIVDMEDVVMLKRVLKMHDMPRYFPYVQLKRICLEEQFVSVPMLVASTSVDHIDEFTDYVQNYVNIRRSNDLYNACAESMEMFKVHYRREYDDTLLYIIDMDTGKIKYNLFAASMVAGI